MMGSFSGRRSKSYPRAPRYAVRGLDVLMIDHQRFAVCPLRLPSPDRLSSSGQFVNCPRFDRLMAEVWFKIVLWTGWLKCLNFLTEHNSL